MTQPEIDEAEWKNPAKWRAGWLGVYVSQQDSRLLVPKKNPAMGFTVNFGHRYWALVLLLLIAGGLGVAFFAVLASH